MRSSQTNLREVAFIVEYMYDTSRSAGYEVYHRLVILVIYIGPFYPLLGVLLLFQTEHMLVKEEL
jgi:hypothetical protein